MVAQDTEKRKKAKFSIKRLLKTGGLLFACAYVIYTLVNQQITLTMCGRMADEYRTKIEQTKKEGQRLQAELDSVGDDEYIVRMAREKLGLIKPNERVFIDATDK